MAKTDRIPAQMLLPSRQQYLTPEGLGGVSQLEVREDPKALGRVQAKALVSELSESQASNKSKKSQAITEAHRAVLLVSDS